MDRDPPDRDPLDRDPPDRDPQTETPWIETPRQRPPEGTWDQAARQEVTSYRDPPVNRQTGIKTVPRPKLCLRTVTMRYIISFLPCCILGHKPL